MSAVAAAAAEADSLECWLDTSAGREQQECSNQHSVVLALWHVLVQGVVVVVVHGTDTVTALPAMSLEDMGTVSAAVVVAATSYPADMMMAYQLHAEKQHSDKLLLLLC